MTRSCVALIAFRLAVLWLIASVFFAATNYLSVFTSKLDDARDLWPIVVRLSFRLGLALLLLNRAQSWARPVGGDELTDPTADRLAITTTGVRVIGVVGLDQWIQYVPSLLGPLLESIRAIHGLRRSPPSCPAC